MELGNASMVGDDAVIADLGCCFSFVDSMWLGDADSELDNASMVGEDADSSSCTSRSKKGAGG